MTKYGSVMGCQENESLVITTETGISTTPKTSIDPKIGTGIRRLKSKAIFESLVRTNLRTR